MTRIAMNIILAKPRGFCAGVERAIEIVEKAIEKYGTPVYVRHEIVHNQFVVDNLKRKGAIFVNELDEVPDNKHVVVFSAHGVSKAVEQYAQDRDMSFIDATCPLVKKVHIEAQRSEQAGMQIILIGHQNHPEVEGTSGRVNQKVILVQSVADVASIHVSDPNNLCYVTQTTLSVNDTKDIIDALTKRFPKIKGPNVSDICFATQNRQEAVKELAKHADVLITIGAHNSSNSNRLRDLGEEMGMKSYLVTDENDIDIAWFKNIENVGITAGASAPKILLNNILQWLAKHFDLNITTMDGVEENIIFKLPKILQQD